MFRVAIFEAKTGTDILRHEHSTANSGTVYRDGDGLRTVPRMAADNQLSVIGALQQISTALGLNFERLTALKFLQANAIRFAWDDRTFRPTP